MNESEKQKWLEWWRDRPKVCGSCGEEVTFPVMYHTRLGCYVHYNGICEKNVEGEDVSMHTMTFVLEDPDGQ